MMAAYSVSGKSVKSRSTTVHLTFTVIASKLELHRSMNNQKNFEDQDDIFQVKFVFIAISYPCLTEDFTRRHKITS